MKTFKIIVAACLASITTMSAATAVVSADEVRDIGVGISGNSLDLEIDD